MGGSSASAAEAKKQVLFLTKSAGFQHSVITRDQKDGNKMAWAEQHLIDLGSQNGFEVTVTKDADVFNDPATYQKYDIFAFYTTGDLTQGAEALALSEIDEAQTPRTRTGIGEFDRILGGGIVPGSAVLVGGEPGIGKSTLLLQVANSIATTKPSALKSGRPSSDP